MIGRYVLSPIQWQTPDPRGADDFGFVSSANGGVYAGSGAGSGCTMYALDWTSGAIRWQFASGGSVMGRAAIVDGTVYWASDYYTKTCPAATPSCDTTYRLYAFDLVAVPTAPTALTSTITDATHKAAITWSPPQTNGRTAVTGYRIAPDGTDLHNAGPWSTTVPATTRTFRFGSTQPGATYHLTVQAVNAAGTGPAATATATSASR